MSKLNEVIPKANHILKKFYLCDYCLGRFFSKNIKSSSYRILGKKIKQEVKLPAQKCYICKNLFENLSQYVDLMLESSYHHDFSTFVVGVKIKPSLIDCDDFVRSKFKLQGVDSIKTGITREISKSFAKKTKKEIDFLNPDITFTLNFKEKFCQIRSKQVSIQGRYNKLKRGFSQKKKSCENCLGKGCRKCNFHGFYEHESVEAKISNFLLSRFGGTVAKFTWIGGEDKSSLVLGLGRPFFVRIQNPIKRKSKFSKNIKLDSLKIKNCKIINEVPKKPLPFISTIKMNINSENKVESESLKQLKILLKKPVVIYENNGKRSEKKILNSHFKKNSKKRFTLVIDVEGGFPIKRFVKGDNVVPGISQTIGTKCTCDEFDFLEVKIITNN